MYKLGQFVNVGPKFAKNYVDPNFLSQLLTELRLWSASLHRSGLTKLRVGQKCLIYFKVSKVPVVRLGFICRQEMCLFPTSAIKKQHETYIFGQHTVWVIYMADGLLTKIAIWSTVKITSVNTPFSETRQGLTIGNFVANYEKNQLRQKIVLQYRSLISGANWQEYGRALGLLALVAGAFGGLSGTGRIAQGLAKVRKRSGNVYERILKYRERQLIYRQSFPSTKLARDQSESYVYHQLALQQPDGLSKQQQLKKW